MQPSEKRLSLGEHLEELRYRVIYSLIGFIVAVVVCFIFQDSIMKVVCLPHIKVMRSLNQTESLHVLKYQETLLAYFKVSILAGLILSTPFILYQMWQFVKTGLYQHEKKYVIIYTLFSLILFVAGVLFGYFFLIPITLKFLACYGNPSFIELNLTLSYYLSLFLMLTLIVGLSFELPLIMLFFSVLGVTSPRFYAHYRKFAIVIIFVIAAIVTPTSDPLTMTILAIPLVGLYELGIILCYLVTRKPVSPK